MIKTVMLDMDGVLVNFRKGICDRFGKPCDYPTSPSKWNFWEDWSGVTFDAVNRACTIDFWRNLEWMHDGGSILGMVIKRFELKHIYLLTTPMPNLESASGKAMWVNKHIPAWNKRLIITRAPKSLLARPDTLLIDDKDQNVDEFYAAGGRACLVPRPWNRAHFCADKSVEVVKKFLEDI
jgi:5'(3')-deoxyribonucleotidase